MFTSVHTSSKLEAPDRGCGAPAHMLELPCDRGMRCVTSGKLARRVHRMTRNVVSSSLFLSAHSAYPPSLTPYSPPSSPRVALFATRLRPPASSSVPMFYEMRARQHGRLEGPVAGGCCPLPFCDACERARLVFVRPADVAATSDTVGAGQQGHWMRAMRVAKNSGVRALNASRSKRNFCGV